MIHVRADRQVEQNHANSGVSGHCDRKAQNVGETLLKRDIIAVADAFALLTKRQGQVLDQLAAGFTNKQIALHLGLSPSTVKTHILSIYQRTRCGNRIELALQWLKYRGVLGELPNPR